MDYDGKEHTVTGYDVAIDNELYTEEDFEFSGTDSVSGTNAGSYDMELKAEDFTNTNENFANVTFAIEDGTLTITKAKVTLTSGNADKEYDGKALTNEDVEGKNANGLTVETGWVEGEGATYEFTGSQLTVGESANTFSYTLNENTKAENYEITKNEGALTITDRTEKYEITLVANSSTGNVYDGTEKSAVGVETDTFTINGVEYTVSNFWTTNPRQKNAGTYENKINIGTSPAEPAAEPAAVEPAMTPMFARVSTLRSVDTLAKAPVLRAPVLKADAPATDGFVVKDAAGNDVSNQFTVTPVDGKLEIIKRPVTLTSATDSKTYDGKALTNDKITVSGDGWVEGEGATYNVTGTQTLVGESENTFTYTLNKGTEAENYEIKTVYGKLTITDDPVEDDLVVTKSHEEGTFGLGDTVTFTITATNIYNEARPITLSEIDGVTLEQATFESVAAGETVTTTATYTITETDILKGEFKNTVTATVGDLTKTAEDTVKPEELEEKDGHLTITKEATSEPANGEAYVLGETIEYKITVLNDGNRAGRDDRIQDHGSERRQPDDYRHHGYGRTDRRRVDDRIAGTESRRRIHRDVRSH